MNIKTFIFDKDYMLYMNIPCEETGKCFIVQDALDDEIFNDEPYLKMHRNNVNVEHCLNSGECDVFVCSDGEDDCEIIFCSEDTIEDDEVCI